GYQEPLELRLFDLTGSLQGAWHIDNPGGDGVIIELPNQPRGLYLLELRSGAMRKTIKLVKAD
ncbi:T9SS type A sorting domain-containing protein, partial [Arthrospira platensis SPKY1]|nr:T9SS type A sorting domain-containing protein [Arthrospira platensis SPKY1]